MNTKERWTVITALLTGLFLAGCQPQVVQVAPPAATAIETTAPEATATSEATTTPEATATPEAGAYAPLSVAECEALQAAMAEELSVEVQLDLAPFEDYISGASGTSCQMTATGTGRDFSNFVEVAASLRDMLQGRGWTEDQAYLADGPTGTASGFRSDSGLCLLRSGWDPAEDANCPDDQPISACQLTPEQQLYTVQIQCAQVPGEE